MSPHRPSLAARQPPPRRPRALAPVALALLIALSSIAAPGLVSDARAATPYDERGTNRLSLDATAGLHSRYPGGVEDPGAMFTAAIPLWYSAVAGSTVRVQADLQLHGLLGIGGAPTVYPGAALSFGGRLQLLSWLSLEARIGPFAELQVHGRGLATVVGLYGAGGYVFHLWDDPRQRLRLSVLMPRGFVTRADAANDDCPVCYGFLGIGLGYETPF